MEAKSPHGWVLAKAAPKKMNPPFGLLPETEK
jgi:hypothetical protein